jgi:ubiquinone/menaquinone biosynthesis C-methylase UbiE
MTDPALQTQKDYYEARAPEYDDWWLRRGRYDRGPEATAAWRKDAETIERWLKESNPHGSILELACGTGIWTEKLARCAAELTCVDASAAMLQHCANRVGASAARFIESDIFEFQSTAKHDVIFFGFWLSHVPPQRFDEFWELVRSAMKPDGRFFFVDSLYNGN